jgi:site-specific recombinase
MKTWHPRHLKHLRNRFRNDFSVMITDLLSSADHKADIDERRLWLERLLRWVHEGSDAGKKSARVRYLSQLLDNNPNWKQQVTSTLESGIRDFSATSLLTQTGFAVENGLWTELVERMLSRILPSPPRNDLLEIVRAAGLDAEDASWLEANANELQPALTQIANLDTAVLENLTRAAREAFIIFAANVLHIGISSDVHERHQLGRIETSPFLRIQKFATTLDLSRALEANDGALAEWNSDLGLCRLAIGRVYADMEGSGVSVGLVYRLEVLSASLDRMDELLQILASSVSAELNVKIVKLLAALIRSVALSQSVHSHFRERLNLLSRKVAERNGHSGEHYRVEGKKGYFGLVFSSICGGMIVVLMTALKFLLHELDLPPLFAALALWLIYSAGFLTMQFAGFTLATKIPSFLAAHLARKLKSVKGRDETQEIAADIRASFLSQAAALAGNLAGVIPFGILISWLYSTLAGETFLSPADAKSAMEAVHPWKSLALPLAALTGVELWLSSLAGGWFENWMVFRKINEAVEKNPRIRRTVGPVRAKKFAAWLSHHSSGIGANLTLGFLFGFMPFLGLTIGLNLESKHVTIASAGVVFASMGLGGAGVTLNLLVSTGVGLIIIGIMNFFVSFSLSLNVAARASGVKKAWLRYFFSPRRLRD